mmetsp:Transcript_24776/g.84854  ORF Transcript_24776/g.84854 Transcript_24776/m.84854 type:complete len:246 (-) Transcript_24776:128-865(-)
MPLTASKRARMREGTALCNDLTALLSGLRGAVLFDYAVAEDAKRCENVASRLRAETPLSDAAACEVDGVGFVLRSLKETAARAAFGAEAAYVRVGEEGLSVAWATDGDAANVDAALRRCAADLCGGLARGDATFAFDAVLAAEARARPPALFGWLLEYPVIYVFDDADRAARALSSTSGLVLYDLFGTIAGAETLATTFSVPLHLAAERSVFLGEKLDAAVAFNARRAGVDVRYTQRPSNGLVAF